MFSRHMSSRRSVTQRSPESPKDRISVNSTRLERVQRQVLRETTTILKEDLKDPRIGFVTVTSAQLSPDFHTVRVFVSIMGTMSEQEETFHVLKKAEGFVRAQLGHRIR